MFTRLVTFPDFHFPFSSNVGGMARLTVAHFLCAFGFLHKGLPVLIETEQTVTVALREDARLTCRLTETKDVVQITWQKLLPAEKTFLASYTRRYGERVNHKLEGKVEFVDAALQRTSILVKNLTEEDECCYRCMFNAVPEGALTGQTCLQVYELHGPVLLVGGSDSTVVSCWATGRPAPTVTISVLQKDLQLETNSSVSITNSNRTFTVNTTAVLSGRPGKGTQVVCTAQVFSHSQTSTLIFPDLDQEPEPQARGTRFFVEEQQLSFSYIYAPFTVLALFLILCIFGLKLYKKNNSSELEKNKTPKEPVEDNITRGTPLMEEGIKVTRRTPCRTPLMEEGIKVTKQTPCRTPLMEEGIKVTRQTPCRTPLMEEGIKVTRRTPSKTLRKSLFF